MIPLRDNTPTATFPILTIALIVINTLIYFFQPPELKPLYEMIPVDITTGHAVSGVLHQFPNGALHFFPAPPEVVNSLNPASHTNIPVMKTIEPVWLTIFTAMFLHANLLHLAGNMLFLWIFGNNVEDALGKFRFLLFYLGCGVVAALAQVAAGPHSVIPTLGASGAIAGILGAYLILYPNARVTTLFIVGLIFLRDISAFWVIGIWIALQVVQGLTGLGGEATGGVAYFAHIGGFAAGLVLTMLMGGRALGERQTRAARFQQY